MRVEHALCKTTGFEQRKAKQNGIANNAPKGGDNVLGKSYALNQNGVNTDTYKNEKSLKTDGE